MKTKEKALNKILKDKSFDVNGTLISKYFDHVQRKNRNLKPKTKAVSNYVGIEFECFTNLEHDEVFAKLLENDLENNVHIGDDGSVHPNFGQSMEMRVLFKEKTLKENLQQLSNVFKNKKFGVNNSCGLHIHLDMRNRDVHACYEKLIKFQNVLFGMVKANRWNNDYCSYNHHGVSVHRMGDSRFMAINKLAYHRHKTIEIRLHHATLDMKIVQNWITLLLKIINSKGSKPIETKNDVLTWAKKNKDISRYVAKNFNARWFNTRKRLVLGLELREALRLERLRQRVDVDGLI